MKLLDFKRSYVTLATRLRSRSSATRRQPLAIAAVAAMALAFERYIRATPDITGLIGAGGSGRHAAACGPSALD